MITDKKILNVYMTGFNDELKGINNNNEYTDILSIAYSTGQNDALIGDDVKSIDAQTSDEILNKIKQTPHGQF